MKKIIYSLFTVLLVAAFSTQVMAQVNTANHAIKISIPELSLLAISGGNEVNFTFVAPSVAGDAPSGTFTSTDKANLWLNYTSLFAGTDRKITVDVTGANDIPSGLTLSVTPAAPTADGVGVKGDVNVQSLQEGQLAGTAVSVVTGIGNCWTGSGASKGVNLNYGLSITDNSVFMTWADLPANQSNTHEFTVTYTLTD